LRLLAISAEPHPFGNRIDLKWENPVPEHYSCVKIIRKEGTYPTNPDDGYIVAEKDSFLLSSTDLSVIVDLDNGTIVSSIFQLFLDNQIVLTNNTEISVRDPGLNWLFSDGDNQFVLLRNNGTINIFQKGMGTVSDTNLKSETVYYYSLFPCKNDPPEYSFDRNNRIAAMATGKYDSAGQMYNLLPRIYHRYDTILSNQVTAEDLEKGELRRFLDIPGSMFDQFHSFAKAILNMYDLQKVDGVLLPQLAQWIGWKTDFGREIKSQRNEIRNAPDLYKRIGIIPTVEATVKRMSGWESSTKEFVHNVFLSNRPERLNIWAQERNNSGEWSESENPLSLDFAYEGRPASVHDGEKVWLFYHTHKKRQWKRATPPRDTCNIWCKTFDTTQGWSPSKPITNRLSIDKHPTAAMQSDKLWLFWSTYSEKNNTWSIESKSMVDQVWSLENDDPFAGIDAERKRPLVVSDSSGGVWLFWLERQGDLWQMKYNRHDGTVWQLSTPADFPMDGNFMEDPFVLFHSGDVTQPIYIFWSRKEASSDPDRKRWVIVYRFKQGIDPTVSDWGAVQTLPKDPTDALYHDREPAALVRSGNIELFWSSNRNGSWSIWGGTLDDIETNDGANANQVTGGPYSQRDPLPLSINNTSLMLIHHSNASVTYRSEVYKATETKDFRYSGCTTVDTRNSDKITLRQKFGDFQAYTYDVRKTNDAWYARDTIGLYLENNTMDKEQVEAGIKRIEKVLSEFMPITDRAVFITKQDVHREWVYNYGLPLSEGSNFINESHSDVLTSTAEEVIPGPGEDIS